MIKLRIIEPVSKFIKKITLVVFAVDYFCL